MRLPAVHPLDKNAVLQLSVLSRNLHLFDKERGHRIRLESV